MARILTIITLSLFLLAPAPALAGQAGTATPEASPFTDADAIVTALDEAEPPPTLPGNDDTEIELLTWEDEYGEPLDGTAGAWVLTGSNQFPIASVLVFDTPESAEAGLGDYAQDTAATTAGDLEAYAVADRGKWLCLATDGPVLLIGQAEPVSTEEDQDAVRERSCEAVAVTHAWLLAAVTGTPPEATPGN